MRAHPRKARGQFVALVVKLNVDASASEQRLGRLAGADQVELGVLGQGWQARLQHSQSLAFIQAPDDHQA